MKLEELLEKYKRYKRQKVEALLKRYAEGYEWKPGKENYYIFYDPEDNRSIYLGCHMTIKASGIIYFPTEEKAIRAIEEIGIIYFPTEEKAIRAIEEIGKERILKDYFQIEK